MINPIRNQKGIALIVTLMLLVLGFAVVAILFRLTTQETKLARLEQGYTTALDAAKAGADVFIDMVQNVGYNPALPNNSYSGPAYPFGRSVLNGTCLQMKMTTYPSSAWATAAWTAAGCPAQNNATSIYPTGSTDLTQYYADTTLTLGNYTVYIKLIDTWFTNGTGTGTPCPNGCNYYTVISRAQAPNSSEHADIQFVYRYPPP